MPNTEKYFTAFSHNIDEYVLPQRFTFPFYYQPHPIALLAVKQLQACISEDIQWQHNFGSNGDTKNATGKMFGILVVKNINGELGYLSAYSGKIKKSSTTINFVPPVCDMFTKDNYFISQQEKINGINTQITQLELNPLLTVLDDKLKQLNTENEKIIATHRVLMIERRKNRKQRRKHAENTLNGSALLQLNTQLGQESIDDKNTLKRLKLEFEQATKPVEKQLNALFQEIESLKQKRKSLSAMLQQQLFAQYQFLNRHGDEKGLAELFKNTIQKIPPAGAGDCAAPKLLQYAFKYDLKPIAMAEFWWGAPPKSEVRQHLNFYGACLGKCQPILAHMLMDIDMDENPLLNNPAAGKSLSVIYHDEAIAIINKPAEFLSVPGKNISDSVYLRMRERFPAADGPLIVHRLDMSTSGLMVIALNKKSHKLLQRQFINRSIKKQYVALIKGKLTQEEGIINLPLRGDLNDRPRQLVCFDKGKPAETTWHIIEQGGEKENPWTKIALFPKTGRTHQLRVHCAHVLGLNSSIIGDDLYGTRAKRLYLHAQSLSLIHPISKEVLHFTCEAEF